MPDEHARLFGGTGGLVAGLMMLPMTLGIMSASLLTGRRVAATGHYGDRRRFRRLRTGTGR